MTNYVEIAEPSQVGATATGSTTRFYVEATDGRTFEGAYFRGSLGVGAAGDGYATLDEAHAVMALVDMYDHRPALRGVRVVEETNTCRLTVVARRG